MNFRVFGRLVLLGLLAASQSVPAQDSTTLDLPEASVQGSKRETGSQEIKSDFIRKIPGAMNDPIRALGFSPGVMVQNDLNVRPFVRGGDADQTRVVLDGIPLLQPYHVGGVFSLFNLNTLESVELYRDDFPVEDPGALSGILRLKTKRLSPEKPEAGANLSLVRGDVFAEVPLVKNHWSAYGAAQTFLFNETLHGVINAASEFSHDSLFQRDIQSYRDHVNLPEFQDYHWGTTYFANENLEITYHGGLSLDAYAVVVPSQTNILSAPITDPPLIPATEIKRSQKLSVDSISSVGIGNQAHFLKGSWDLNSRNVLENNLAFQSQNWDVRFKKPASNSPPLALSRSSRIFSYQLDHTFTPSDNHRFEFGLSYDYQTQTYDAEIPFVLYDVIVNSNADMLSPLGDFSDQGFRIDKEDPTKSNLDYLGDYPERIRFSHHGRLEEQFGGLFFSHTWTTATGTLTYGLRTEYQNTSDELFSSPRASYRWKLKPQDELLFHGGLFSQNNLPFYERDENPGLRSEKSAQVGAQWIHAFGPGYRLSVDNYYKRYFDLVAATLVPNYTVDLKSILLPLPNSPLSQGEIVQLKSILDTTQQFSALSDSLQQLAYQTFGGLTYHYANTGTGNSLGTEFSFFYSPTPTWKGWASADFSLSNRQDADNRPSYPYANHRPVVFNWVNTFSIPNDYEFSLTYRWAMGQAYTPYSGTVDTKGDTTPIYVGARNSGRLSPYNRLDVRLSRNVRWWHSHFKAYIEVWNATNSPNYFSRDAETGQLKSAQLNWPFPLFFLGLNWEM